MENSEMNDPDADVDASMKAEYDRVSNDILTAIMNAFPEGMDTPRGLSCFGYAMSRLLATMEDSGDHGPLLVDAFLDALITTHTEYRASNALRDGDTVGNA